MSKIETKTCLVIIADEDFLYLLPDGRKLAILRRHRKITAFEEILDDFRNDAEKDLDVVKPELKSKTLELNPNFIFEGHFAKGLYGLVGIGGSIGYSWNTLSYQGFFGVWHSRSDFGKCGANGIFGLEYKFNAPVALQLDFRPGYGCLFAKNLGVRYTF